MMTLPLDTLGGVLWLLTILTASGIVWLLYATRRRRPDDGGFSFVYVEDSGGAREVTLDERKYLEAVYYPDDGGRPYIKFRYESRAPDGRLGGFLKRRQLPQRVAIAPAPAVVDDVS
jgi:hypothetical protein